jgi:large subunit ribosomal protein L18|tara:strand:+ start:3517 stop:3852 length:336 start_codon:yes stop_codon:yes gene_type:complete
MSIRAFNKKKAIIKRLGAYRALVRRTNSNIYVSLSDPSGKMMVTVSTLSPAFKETKKYGGNIESANVIGKLFAAAVIKLGVKKIAFDCGGDRYHGRIKALAEGARSAGLIF